MEEWRSFTKEKLDHEFSNSRFSHRMGPDEVIRSHIQVLDTESKKVREGGYEEIVLGTDGPEHAIHLFTPAHVFNCPILIYLHGGYWQELTLSHSSFMVTPLIEKNIAVATIGYDLCPKVTMETLLKQVEKAVSKILPIATEKGMGGVYICGHSAGGHLAVMMQTVEWSEKYKVNGEKLIKGIIPVSGVYDLRPLVDSCVNDALRMTNESAWDLSPLKHIQLIAEKSKDKKLLIVCAEHDAPQFQLQAKQFEQELKNNGVNPEMLVIENTDHFDVIEKLKDVEYSLTKKLISLIQSSEQVPSLK